MSSASASAPVSYLLLGDTRAGALRAALTSCIARWRMQWAAPGSAGAHIDLHLQGQTPLLACGGHSSGTRMTGAGGPLLDILTGVDVLAGLVGIAAHASGAPLLQPTEHRELAEDLRSEILESLAQSLAAAAGLRDVTIEASTTTFAEMARRVAGERRVCASVGFGRPGTQLLLFLSPLLVERFLPLRQPQDGDLEHAAAAIDAQTVYVEALLGHSDLTLRELASLAPGDVVILEHDLRQAGRLEVRGHAFAQTTLGRSNELRAVRVAGFTGSARS